MGNAVATWNQHAPSLCSAGKQSLVTEPIKKENVTVERFLNAAYECTKNRGRTGKEFKYEARVLSNGGIHVKQTYWIPGIFNLVVNSVSYIDRAQGLIAIQVYMDDETLQPQSHALTLFIKPHMQPFRVEAWTEQHNCRQHSDLAAAFVEDLLAPLGLGKVDIAPSQPSPTAPGQLSVLTGPIQKHGVTANNFISFCRQEDAERRGRRSPQGFYDIDQTSWFLPTIHTRCFFDEAKGEIRAEDYGGDKTRAPESLRTVSVTKVLRGRDSFCLEVSSQWVQGRRAGQAEQDLISEIVEHYLSYL